MYLKANICENLPIAVSVLEDELPINDILFVDNAVFKSVYVPKSFPLI